MLFGGFKGDRSHRDNTQEVCFSIPYKFKLASSRGEPGVDSFNPHGHRAASKPPEARLQGQHQSGLSV